MKKLILTALAGAALLPALATGADAQSNRELRRDRQDIRQEQRDVERARRTGSPAEVRKEQRDVREARQEYREDARDRDRRWRDNDWQDWRRTNRGAFARGGWNAPFRYRGFTVGARIAPLYFGSRYVIADPWRYRLPPAAFGQRWVRHYDDVLLVDIRSGVVRRVLRNFYF